MKVVALEVYIISLTAGLMFGDEKADRFGGKSLLKYSPKQYNLFLLQGVLKDSKLKEFLFLIV